MLQVYPTYEGLVSYSPIGKLGSFKTFNLPQDTYNKVFPKPQSPSINDLNTSFFKEAGIYSSSTLRNARLYSSGLNINPLQRTGLLTTDNIPIYTTSFKNFAEKYWIGILTKGSLFDTFF
ncbi:hypothetical protein ACFL5H_04000 [Candidatus Latescibacterota bacterium]